VSKLSSGVVISALEAGGFMPYEDASPIAFLEEFAITGPTRSETGAEKLDLPTTFQARSFRKAQKIADQRLKVARANAIRTTIAIEQKSVLYTWTLPERRKELEAEGEAERLRNGANELKRKECDDKYRHERAAGKTSASTRRLLDSFRPLQLERRQRTDTCGQLFQTAPP
jgi:hypothetical protein